MFVKLGHFAYRARWWIVAFWIVIVGMAALFAPNAHEVLKSGGFSLPDSESIQAIDVATEKFGGFRSELYAIFTAPPGTRVDDPAFAKAVDDAVAGARQYKDTIAVLTYASTGDKSFVSADGRYTYADIGQKVEVDTTEQNLDALKATLKPGNLDMRLAGLPVTFKEFNMVSQSDLEKAEALTLPLALIILLLVFRTLVAAAMPLIMALCSVAITLATVYFLGQAMDLSIFVLNIATILGLGIGIDYSLFIVSRFREEMYRREGNVEEAVVATVSTAGRATFFSGLTVMIALLSLIWFEFMALRSVGIGGAIVVLLSVLAALTLLPAVLSILGRRINSLKVPFLKPVDVKMEEAHNSVGFWHRLAEFVMRHPVAILVVVLVFLGIIGSPFLHVRFGEPSFEILPENDSARLNAELMQQQFPSAGKSSDVFLLVQAKQGDISDPQNIGALYDYTRSLKQNPVVKSISSPVDLPLPTPMTKEQYQGLWTQFKTNPAQLPPAQVAGLKRLVNDGWATIRLDTTIEYSSESAHNYIESLRHNRPAAFNLWVSGSQAALMDFVDKLYADFPIAILVVVIITYVTLMIMFKSAVLPLKAVIMTGLSLAASYGALVFVFQDGNLSWLLGIKGLGYVEATLPVIMFGVLFGLSMDYEVFLLTRVREVYDQTGNNTKSVAMGLERTGGIITSAALIMIIVAGSFGTADIVIIKAIGIGMALAVAVDATIVRALLVPATMKLLGEWNWWLPGFIRQRLPELKME